MSVDYKSFTDQGLLEAIKNDDMVAFDEIYRRYWKQLYKESFRRSGSTEKSEELIQDVFTELWVKRQQQQVKELYPYLYALVRYKTYALYRKNKGLPKFEEPLDYMAETTAEGESMVNEKQLKAFVLSWMSEQPEKRKEIFRLKFFEDLSTLEISKSLKISQNTVQNQLNTAFKSLRVTLARFVSLLL